MKVEVDEYDHIQKRNFFRLDVSFNFTFARLTEPEESGGDISVYRGTVRNLSGSGLAFESDALLATEEYIVCWFTLARSFITVKGKVLGAGKYQGSDNPDNPQDIYTYRIVFVDIESSIQDKIIQYILDKQREILTNQI